MESEVKCTKLYQQFFFSRMKKQEKISGAQNGSVVVQIFLWFENFHFPLS